MVAPERIELSHPCEYQILSLARLPIPPQSHTEECYSPGISSIKPECLYFGSMLTVSIAGVAVSFSFLSLLL